MAAVESVDTNDGEVLVESQSSPKKRKSSEVWNHFSIDKGNDGKSTAKCTHCDKVYSYEGSKYGTSTLSRHLGKCKKKPKLNDVSAMFLDHEGKMRVRGKSIDQNICRDWITKVSIAHDLPLKWIEYKTMRGFLKYLNPDIQFVTRNTVSSDIFKMYEIEKDKLKSILKNVPGMVCLTSDVWTACTNVGYICVTAHFVDSNWKLNNKLLAFCSMPPPHSGRELAHKIYDCLVDWGIDTKVFSLTLDNASANISMVNILKSRLLLQNSLLSNGDYFHVRCCAHILNLIVQDGLKVSNDVLDKIRGCVKYVKGSEARMVKFRESAQKVGIEIGSSVSLDVPTRWNSTYLMLSSAIKYRSVFGMLAFDDLAFKNCPTDDEWERGEKMSDFLRPFYVITNLISGSSYPTSNLYFMEVWKIQCLLDKNSLSDDKVIREMSCSMKEKFNKYWEQYSEILAMGAVFDPRMKLTMLEYCYSKLDATSSREKIDEVEKIARMACDVLSIPITTVTSESSFSIGAHVLNKYRNRLLPQKVQALLCTRNWLHGYTCNDDEEFEDDDNDGSARYSDAGEYDEEYGDDYNSGRLEVLEVLDNFCS